VLQREILMPFIKQILTKQGPYMYWPATLSCVLIHGSLYMQFFVLTAIQKAGR